MHVLHGVVSCIPLVEKLTRGGAGLVIKSGVWGPTCRSKCVGVCRLKPISYCVKVFAG